MEAKYHSKISVVDGITFHSKKESRRYIELKAMQKAGIIRDLKLQVRFELLPYQRQFKERSVVYVADFVYIASDGVKVVEDTKGFKTKDYIIKRKLFRWLYCQDGSCVFKEV